MNEAKLTPDSYFIKKMILIAIVVACIAISGVGAIDNQTESYVDDAIIQSTLAYSSARALNAVISVAQSVQVGVSAVGESSFQPLEILDPVNDMVEDYATAMKYSITSLIIQKLIIEIMANDLFKWLMLGVGVLLAMSLFISDGIYASALFKGFTFIALIRFMFVATVFLSSLVNGIFLNNKTNDKINTVKYATESLKLESSVKDNLSSTERYEINQKIDEKESQRNELDKRIKRQNEVVYEAKLKMQSDERILDEINKKRGIIDRYNFFRDDIKEEGALDASTDVYKNAVKKRDEYKNDRDDLNSDLQELQESLHGNNDFFSNIKKKINSARFLFDTQEIKKIMENAIDAMLKLIAFFIFKTLIMPILFLFLIIRSFKLIWKIDPRSFFKGKDHLAGE